MRLHTRRYKRILIAGGVTLLTSAILLGVVGLTRWRGRQALQSDTRSSLIQASQQLNRTVQSRRSTLTFIRDTLNRRADLTRPQLEALAASGVAHTRHLLGLGLIKPSQSPQWWAKPTSLSDAELDRLKEALARRTRLRGIWRVSSTFVITSKPGRALLIMLEPLAAASYRPAALIGVFDLNPLLKDFFTSSLLQPYPVQLLDGKTVLYRSDHWQTPPPDRRPVIAEYPFAVDAARWIIHMQPGTTPVVQTLSRFNVLVMGLSIVAGLGVTIIVWILAARTWILQRAVARRTAALRRTSERLRHMATTDELTGVYNRRFFLNRWTWEWDRAKRYGRPLACLMVDVNGFKQVNDRLGHHAGDLVLQQVAQELKTMLRQSDILARFGGDEFIIALPETSTAQAETVAEKLRQVRIPLPIGARTKVEPVSLSVGMSRLDETKQRSPQELLEAADQSLYTWKRRQHAPSAPTR